MTGKDLVLEQSEDFESLEKLYDESFPISERREIDLLSTLINLERAHLFLLKSVYGTPLNYKEAEDGEADGENYYERSVAAFAYVYDGGERVLIDYLAVNKIYRNGGMGSEMLAQLKDYYFEKKVMVVEIERPGCGKTDAQNLERKKRQEFYLRNGFIDAGFKVKLDGDKMDVMILPIQEDFLERDDYLNIYVAAFGEYFTMGYVGIDE